MISWSEMNAAGIPTDRSCCHALTAEKQLDKHTQMTLGFYPRPRSLLFHLLKLKPCPLLKEHTWATSPGHRWTSSDHIILRRHLSHLLGPPAFGGPALGVLNADSEQSSSRRWQR